MVSRILSSLALVAGCAAFGVEWLLPAQPRHPGRDGGPSLPGGGEEEAVRAEEERLRRAWRGAWDASAPKWSETASAAFAQAAVAQAAAPGLPDVLPPMDLRLAMQQGGVLLSWSPNPANPVEGIRYRITRWAGDGPAEELAEVDGIEYLDLVPCEGLTYHYRVRCALRLPGPRPTPAAGAATRESTPAAASLEVPASAVWSAAGLDGQGNVQLILERPLRPREGPWPARPGQAIGESGWFVESLEVRETEVRSWTSVPRFDALGRRVVAGDRPASRSREVTSKRLLARLRLLDPCGSPWNLDLLLPEIPGPPAR